MRGSSFKGKFKNLLYRRKVKAGPRALVLAYHRVINLANDWQLLAVSPKNFEEQLRVLKDEYVPVTVKALTEGLREGKIQDKAVALTFDDGYLDNFEFALPLLKKYEVPATIYISTHFTEHDDEFYWDKLEYICSQGKEDQWDVTKKCCESYHVDYLKLCDALKPLSVYQRRVKIHELITKESLIRRKSHSHMNPMQVKECNKHELIEIGAHTVNHLSLANFSKEVQVKEIIASKKYLEKVIESEVLGFAYPYGSIKDFNENSMKIVKENSFNYAMANFPGLVWKGSDIYALPRYLVRNWNFEEFNTNMQYWYSCKDLSYHKI